VKVLVGVGVLVGVLDGVKVAVGVDVGVFVGPVGVFVDSPRAGGRGVLVAALKLSVGIGVGSSSWAINGKKDSANIQANRVK